MCSGRMRHVIQGAEQTFFSGILFRGCYICQSAMRVTCPLLLAAVHVVAQSSQSLATGEWTYANPISAVTTSCKAQLGLEPKIASNQPCAAHYLEPLLIITSTSTSSLRTYRSVNFTGTIFSRTSPKPIVFYHEASWEVGQGKAPFRMSDLPLHMSTSTCPVDLFEAVPQLQHLLTSCESCIDEYYRVAGGKEPLTGNTFPNWKLSGKVLSRKVVAIYDALQRMSLNSQLLWLDFDVSFKSSDLEFSFSFMQRFDVTYLPFRFGNAAWTNKLGDNPRVGLSRLKEDHTWIVDTGILALRVSPATRSFVQKLLNFYDFDAAILARTCLCNPSLRFFANSSVNLSSQAFMDVEYPCKKSWFQENLYLDDLYVWSLFLHWDLRRMPSALSHGQFAMTKSSNQTAAGICGWRRNWRLVCPNATYSASPFPISDYFIHGISGGGAYATLRKDKIPSSILNFQSRGWKATLLHTRINVMARNDSLRSTMMPCVNWPLGGVLEECKLQHPQANKTESLMQNSTTVHN